MLDTQLNPPHTSLSRSLVFNRIVEYNTTMELILAIIGFIVVNLLITLYLRSEIRWDIEFAISRGLQRLKSIFGKKFP